METAVHLLDPEPSTRGDSRPAGPRRRDDRPDGPARTSRDAIAWFALAVASLALSGLFSLILVLGRLPLTVASIMPDPALAQRSLVVHVNLAMGVWFFACIAGLYALLPGGGRWRLSRAGVVVATAGVILQSLPIAMPSAVPVLSNYVPVLDHPIYLLGLIVFAAGILLAFADRPPLPARRLPDALPADARHGLRAAALVFVVALLTIAGALASQPLAMDRDGFFEHLFWGGGHVLQTANTLGMLAAWLILLHHLTGRAALGSRAAATLFALMVLPTIAGPWLTLGMHPGTWFTRMMQYGIFPVVLIVMARGAWMLWPWRHNLDLAPRPTPALVGLACSVVMTLAGFVLGAMIVADTTLTPAHYHANIGAVTVAHMTVLMVLLPRLGAAVPWPRLARWQPLIYATGQMLFVLGLAIAGTLGQAPRKTYGQVPHVLAPPERIGLMIVGIGGILALGGGVLFIATMVRAAWNARRQHA